MQLHLAQMNVATLRYRPDDPKLVSFAMGARLVGRASAAAPGHRWNEQTIVADSLFVTRSVWESLESLRAFVFSGIHARYRARSSEWFVPDNEPHLALWSILPGETPSVEEAIERLDLLRRQGPHDEAFDFQHVPATMLLEKRGT